MMPTPGVTRRRDVIRGWNCDSDVRSNQPHHHCCLLPGLRPGRDRHHRYRYCRQLLLTRTHHSARPDHAAGATWALPLPRAHHSAWATLVLHAIAVAVVTVMTPGVSAEDEAGEEDHGDDEYNPRNNSDPRQNLADPARTVVPARRRHSRLRL